MLHLLSLPLPAPDPALSAEVAPAPLAWRVPDSLPLSDIQRRLSEATPLLTTDPQAAREILTAPATPDTLTMDA